jgi:hypothetical protein
MIFDGVDNTICCILIDGNHSTTIKKKRTIPDPQGDK